MRDIAERLPATVQDLERIRNLPPGVVRRRGGELIALVERGRIDAVNEAAAVNQPRPDPQQLALVDKLLGFARAQAQALNISPETLATRRDVERLVSSGRTDRLVSGWRREALGERLIELARESGVSAGGEQSAGD